MSLKSEPIGPIPEETMRIAKAAFPKGTRFMKMRDELGTLYHDEMFADLFSATGQPALARFLVGSGDHYAIRRRIT